MKLESFRQITPKWQLFLIAGVTAILLVLGSYSYYHSEEKRIKEEKHNMLKVVADLKTDDISQYFKERRADLMTFAESQTIRDNLQLWLETNNEEAKENLIQRMSLAKKYYDYENVFITSPSGQVYLSPDTIHKLDPSTLAFIKNANENHEAEYSDLYFCPTHKAIHFDLISPVRNKQNVIDALIILRINPDKYLFPLLQTWPTPSKSSEVLLVRKDGNDVLYLNELKFQKNTALNFRLSLTRNDLPAVQAVLGRTGVFEGKDYRGVDVLSDLRPMPGAPWFMISKIDQAEVYSELKYRAVIIFLFITIILILLGTGLAWLYSARQKNIYKQLFLAKSVLRQTQEEFKITLYSIGDAVITTNTDSLIFLMNPVAEQLTGWKEQDAKGKPLDEVFRIINEETRKKVENPVKKVIEKGLVVGLANHTLLISKDGKEIPIADSGAPIRDQDKKIIGVVLVFRDQTEERAAQKALQESTTLIQNIVDNNPSLIYVVDAVGRIQLVNKALANVLGVSKEDIKGKAREDFMPKEIAEKHWNNDLLVINSKQLQSFEEENMESDGKHSYLTQKFPLMDSDGKVYAVGGISTDITERKQAELELNRSETLLNETQRITKVGGWEYDVLTNETYYSAEIFNIYGIDKDKMFKPEEGLKFYHPDDRTIVSDCFTKAITLGEPYDVEVRFINARSENMWVRTAGKSVLENGKVVKVIGNLMDITERKQAEQQIIEAKEKAEESESKLKAALESMSDAVFISDRDGNFLDFNDAFATFHRFKNKQECAKTFKEYPLFLDVYFPNGVLAQIEQWVVPSALRGEMGMNKEFTLLRRDTNETWIGSYNYAPIRNNEDQIIGSVVTCRDITDSKKAQFELIASKEKAEENQERFDLAMKASTDGLFDWNLETNDIYYASAWKKMLGYEDDELPNDFSVWETTTDPEDVKKSWELQQKLISKQIDRFVLEFKMKHKDGHWIDILSRAEAIFNDSGKAIRIVGTHTDITERKLAEEEIRKQLDELRRWQEVTLGRESRVLELKQEVNELLKQRGEALRYEYTMPDDPDATNIS